MITLPELAPPSSDRDCPAAAISYSAPEYGRLPWTRWSVASMARCSLGSCGIRRTVATRMAGVEPHVIEAVLNHYSGHRVRVAGIYNKSPYEQAVKAALALWAEHVLAVVEGRGATS
jgi:hypothetical protein